MTGAYTRFTFNVSGLALAGTNSLAIEVNPNDPNTMFTLDNVDWTQIPPDNNTGIQFPVQLAVDGALSVGNSHVDQNDAADLSSAALTVKTDVTNNTTASQTGTVDRDDHAAEQRHADHRAARPSPCPASTTQTVSFTPGRFPALTITIPQVWWPYQLGAQPLYALAISVAQGSTQSNSTSETFGIRTVTSYAGRSNAVEPSGARAFKINGVPFVIRGGGFAEPVPALLGRRHRQADRPHEEHGRQHDPARGPHHARRLLPADGRGGHHDQRRLPVLRRVGQQTHTGAAERPAELGADDRAEPAQPPERVQLPVERQRSRSATQDTVRSPGSPPPISTRDPADLLGRVQIQPRRSATPGEKEGPVRLGAAELLVRHDAPRPAIDQTNAGGSWGFDSEESAGDTIPTLDSLNRFMSAGDQSELWQSPRPTSTTPTTRPRATPATPSARSATSTRR